MEQETIYNIVIVVMIILLVVAVLFVFVLRPMMQKSLDQQNFEQERDIFLSRFCTNIGYQSYKIGDISDTVYNLYCYTEQGGNVRTGSYFRYDYENKDGKYQFFIVKEKKM